MALPATRPQRIDQAAIILAHALEERFVASVLPPATSCCHYSEPAPAPGATQQPAKAGPEPYHGIGFSGCTLTGPGRGDCAHFDPEGPKGPWDNYGRPVKWCWTCWKDYKLEAAENRLALAKEYIDRLGRTAYGFDIS